MEGLTVRYYLELKHRFDDCDIELKPWEEKFECCPYGANGSVIFENLREAERFIRGYELGLKSPRTLASNEGL